ncbi:MAG TPA: hypothetical protein V6D20_23875 [Candidatus Obscuribacterales bacterium]
MPPLESEVGSETSDPMPPLESEVSSETSEAFWVDSGTDVSAEYVILTVSCVARPVLIVEEDAMVGVTRTGGAAKVEVEGVDDGVEAKEVDKNGNVGVGPGPKFVGDIVGEGIGGGGFITQQDEGKLHVEGAAVFRMKPSSVPKYEAWSRTELGPLYRPVNQRLSYEVS